MASNYFPKTTTIGGEDPLDVFSVPVPQDVHIGKCSDCGKMMFGIDHTCQDASLRS